jgi:hypothetical protein
MQLIEIIRNKLIIVQLKHTLFDMHEKKDEYYEIYEQQIE